MKNLDFEKAEKGQRIGGYVADLMKKNLIEVEASEDEVWVEPDTFAEFCPYM